MATATGQMFRTTATSGFPPSPRTGRRIAMDAGCMNRTMDGPGFRMNRGAGLHITMGAGLCMAEIGAGGPVRFTVGITRFGLRPTFRSSVLEAAVGALWDSELVLAASETWAGCHADLAIASSRGMAAALAA
jgi:hypothetical protein